MAKSKDLRDVVFSHIEKGECIKSIYKFLAGNVSLATIYRWKKCFNQVGNLSIRPRPGRPRSARTLSNTSKVSECLAKRKSAKQTTSIEPFI